MTEPLSDEEVKQSHNDLEMLRRPHLWPHKKVLPLIRNTGADREYIVVAYVTDDGAADTAGTYLVSEGPLGFEPNLVARGGDFLLRTLVDAGWRVD